MHLPVQFIPRLTAKKTVQHWLKEDMADIESEKEREHDS
jgi:hypothetical protein